MMTRALLTSFFVFSAASCTKATPSKLPLNAVCTLQEECSSGVCQESRCVEGSGDQSLQITNVTGDSNTSLSALTISGRAMNTVQSGVLAHSDPAATVPLILRQASATVEEITADLGGPVRVGETYELQVNASAQQATRDVTIIAGAPGPPGPVGPGVSQLEMPIPTLFSWVQGPAQDNPSYTIQGLIARNLTTGPSGGVGILAGQIGVQTFPVTSYVMFRVPFNAKVGERFKLRALITGMGGNTQNVDGTPATGGSTPLTFTFGCSAAGEQVATNHGEQLSTFVTLPADPTAQANKVWFIPLDLEAVTPLGAGDVWCSFMFQEQPLSRIPVRLYDLRLVYTPSL